MSPLRAAARRTFAALSVRNFRLYMVGQIVSMSGTWMQSIAQVLLVLNRLHGTGFDVGLVLALQFLPMLLFGTVGGLLADRVDKRHMLLGTQSAAGVLALTLGLLTLTGAVRLWHVYLLATLLGLVTMIDNPTRQAFVSEMVGHRLVPNAVSLNSVVMNSARVIGPAAGGALIVTIGISSCFLANAASYVAVIAALLLMRTSELERHPPVLRAKGQVRDGLRYSWRTPVLRDTLLVVAVAGIFAFNFNVTLPLFAEVTFHGGAGTYAAFSSALGLGAIVGGLLVASRSRPSPSALAAIGLSFGGMLAVVAISPGEVFAVAALVVMGAAMIAFTATANATLQLSSEPTMRGRVMALYATAFLGSTPIGGPLVGGISDISNPRVVILLGGAATFAACLPMAKRYRRAGWQPLTAPGRAEQPSDGEVPEMLPEPVPEPRLAPDPEDVQACWEGDGHGGRVPAAGVGGLAAGGS